MTKRQTSVNKTLYRKLKTKQHEFTNTEVNSVASEWQIATDTPSCYKTNGNTLY